MAILEVPVITEEKLDAENYIVKANGRTFKVTFYGDFWSVYEKSFLAISKRFDSYRKAKNAIIELV